VVATHEYRKAMENADKILQWAIKMYPQFTASGIPCILSTYATAAAIFVESGYTWYESSKDGAFVPRYLLREKYPMIPFMRSRFLVSKVKGPLTYYAVHESFVKELGNARIYLPTIEEAKALIKSRGSVPRIAQLLIIPIQSPEVQKILEVQAGDRPSDEDGQDAQGS
jgi:hypothetical protein